MGNNDMAPEYGFSKGVRGAVIPMPPVKSASQFAWIAMSSIGYASGLLT
jgi:hypothetical protein